MSRAVRLATSVLVMTTAGSRRCRRSGEAVFGVEYGMDTDDLFPDANARDFNFPAKNVALPAPGASRVADARIGSAPPESERRS